MSRQNTRELTQEQKDTVLNLIRAGRDRSQAAAEIGVTGTLIKRMCNPTAVRYDHDFHLAYEKALAERDQDYYLNTRPRTPAEVSTTTTPRGYTKAAHITDEQKALFIEYVTLGTPNFLAADEIGTSMHQIKSLCRKDPAFHEAYQAALQEGEPNFRDLIRAEYVKQALKEGNIQALRDLAIVHLPEFEKLRTSKHEVSGPGGQPIQVLQAVIQDLPPEIRDALIRHEEQKALEAGKPQIPAVVDDEAA